MNSRTRDSREQGLALLPAIGIILAALALVLLAKCAVDAYWRTVKVSAVAMSGPPTLPQGAPGVYTGTIQFDRALPYAITFDVELYEDDNFGDVLLARKRVTAAAGVTSVDAKFTITCRRDPTPELLKGANGVDDDEDAPSWHVYMYVVRASDTLVQISEDESNNQALECVLEPSEVDGQ